MDGSIQRVRAVIEGEAPDRTPLYDLLRNDAVINHFTGETLTVANGRQLVYRAYEPAIDATRPYVRPPEHEQVVTLADGRRRQFFRWTIWTDLPLLNGMFYVWHVRSALPGQPYTGWADRNFLYFADGIPQWANYTEDVTDLLQVGPERVQIALGVVDYAEEYL